MNEKIMAVEPAVWKILQKRQRYAGHWEASNKQEKEIMVVCHLLHAILRCEGRDWIKEIRPGPCINEPPDCIGLTTEGARVAFEVTELVEQSMIERRKKGQTADKDWTPDEVTSRLQAKISDKGLRSFSKNAFDSVVLVIHTAERQLRPSEFGPAITAHRFTRCGQIDEAYLIFPPGPPRLFYRSEPRICPYFRLSFG